MDFILRNIYSGTYLV